MIDTEEAVKEILKLKDGESWIYPESDYGAGEILLQYGSYFLFEIPQYGGEPRYSGVFTNYKENVCDLISEIERWT